MEYLINTQIKFGNGVLDLKNSFNYLAKKKVLLITNKLIYNLYLIKLHEILKNLKCNLCIKFIKDQEPIVEDIDRNFKKKNKKYNYILAIGGGSVIDFAKAASIKISYPSKCIWDFANHKTSKKLKIGKKLIPIISIPTTAGTGAEITPYCVISKKKNIKSTIKSKKIIPKKSILDPSLLKNLPRKIKFFTAIDALAHSIESFLSSKKKPKYVYVSSAVSIFLIVSSFKRYYFLNNANDCEKILLASLLAGYSISNGGTAAPHAFGQAVGVVKNINHAESIAMFLYNVLKLTHKSKLKNLNYTISDLFNLKGRFNVLNEVKKIYSLQKIKKIKLTDKDKHKIFTDLKENRVNSLKKFPFKLNENVIEKLINKVSLKR